jgi:hypothetical protein
VVEELSKQDSALVRYQNHLASDAYHLLTNVRIVCLGEVGRYDEQQNLIGKMMAVYSICEGTTSPELARLSQLKVSVVAHRNEELNLKELSIKQKICTSKVPLDQLRVQGINEPLPIDASKLDFTLFN